jgi:hypothetical protein
MTTTTVTDRLKETSQQRSRKTPEQTAAEKARKAKAGKDKGMSGQPPRVGQSIGPVRPGDEAKVEVEKAARKAPKKDRKIPEELTVLGNERTTAWPSKNGREVKKGDEVKMADGDVGVVLGRFTVPTKDGTRVPSVAVRVEGRSKSIHVPASTVTHTTKTPNLKTALDVSVGQARGKAAADALHAETVVQRATAAVDAAEVAVPA